MTTESIIKKIKALRARATDEASTEAEAAMAARIADDLLRTHNLTLTDVEARAEGVVKGVWGTSTTRRGQMKYAAGGIAKATGTKTWHQWQGGHVFLGSPADVETALYFMDLVQTAMQATWRAHQRTATFKAQKTIYGARKVGNDFRTGVAARLGERIRAEHERAEADGGEMSNGTALVLVKNAMIEQWCKDNNLRLVSSGRGPAVGSGYSSGRNAAEGVAIGRGIGTNNRALQLGAR